MANTDSTEKTNNDNKRSLIQKLTAWYEYCVRGVWSDSRHKMSVRVIKTINLSVSSFFDRGLQNISMALTYSTVLSIVPALALLVAIGRGFGLADMLQKQIYYILPSQSEAIATMMKFVDSYLTSATQGVFVGVGIVVLLYTVISLLSQIEDAFNAIWDVKVSRTIYQKITDYIAICLIIPILMICSSGLSFIMSDVIQSHLILPFLSPLVNVMISLIPLVLCWLAFTLSYYLIPNTKVQFKYAAIAGIIAAIGFQILQMLFMNGQIYVSKYNAIYGSFAFLPLLLIWLQFSWLLLLAGCMICFSMQNVFTFNLMGDTSTISYRGWHNVALVVMSVICKRFVQKEKPLTVAEIAVDYMLPVKIVSRVTQKLKTGGLVYRVKLDNNETGLTPAIEIENFSVGDFLREFDNVGQTAFIPYFRKIYAKTIDIIESHSQEAYSDYNNILVKDLPLPTPEEIKKIYAKT